jgi:hypothetical protein
MSWWTSTLSYLGLFAILCVALAFSWRLPGKAGRRIVTVIAVVLVVALCPFPILSRGMSPRCVVAVLLNLPYLVDTGRYAPGYSHARFRNVKIGMAQEEVMDLLGEPLERYWVSTGHTGWVYADDSPDTRVYVFACVYFPQKDSGIVVEKKWGVGWR